jgi:cytochrome d ubiquinol oxidase subunit I
VHDVVWLSRLQFALTIMFHYLFPPLTIGMSIVLVYLEAMYLRKREAIYEIAARFWTKIFALNFAVGVATGIVMEFQFGTNWAVYSRFVGDVFGSALAAEGIFAFFLESGFLAVLVFGWDRVGPRFHFLSTIMVSLGSIFSSIWITVANSWQQTPAGHHVVTVMRDGKPWIVDGQVVRRAEMVDFWQVVFNPSTVNRLVHVWIAAVILGTFFIMSISAWYLLHRRHTDFARRSFTGALVLGALASCGMIFSGHQNSRMVAHEQPSKMAAFEANFETGPAALHVFGVPRPDERKVAYGVSWPGLLSWLIHDDTQASVPGLDEFRREDWPPVGVSFFSYHFMVGLGFFFVAITLLALALRWTGSLFRQRWLLWIFVFAVVGPFAANELGWVAAEVGRQPWIVAPRPVWADATHLVTGPDGFAQMDTTSALRTSHAISGAVQGPQVLASIVLFGLVYLLLGAVWVYVLDHKIRLGPEPAPEPVEEGVVGVASELVDHAGSLTEAKDGGAP